MVIEISFEGRITIRDEDDYEFSNTDLDILEIIREMLGE